jgi:phosphoribosylanthranilate isomerase
MPVRIKICGLTNPDDAVCAAELGCDAIGLNFFSRSPRFISVETARTIVRALPTFVEPVAVVVDLGWQELVELSQTVGSLQWVQRYGTPLEGPPPSALRFIPAFPVRDAESLARITDYLDRCSALNDLPSAILVDAHAPGRHGGTGQQVPWQLLANFCPAVPLILAGGLTPENVAEAIRIVRPFAVDVASGVEAESGRKDTDKMKRFIENARAAI